MRLSSTGRLPAAAQADPKQDREDAGGGPDRGPEVAGDLAHTGEAAAVADRNLTDAEAVGGGFDLHREVPAVGELVHAELFEGVAADGAEGAHVGVADAVREAQQPADQMSGEDLGGEHGPGFAVPEDAAAEDEVGLIGKDGGEEAGQIGGVVGAVAIHEDEDGGFRSGGLRAGETGGTVTAGGEDD